MADEKQILRAVTKPERGDERSHPDFVFWCPGCKCGHGIWTTKQNHQSALWTFNGNMEKPTFTPSLKITTQPIYTDDEHARIMAGEKIMPRPYCCHSVVTDGVINFCADCTHELAGKSVPMQPF
jgi:hypothetical protein